MTGTMRDNFIHALEGVAAFMESVESDFRVNRLHHSDAMENTKRCLKKVLVPPGSARDVDLMINHKVHDLEDSLADIDLAVQEKVNNRIRFSSEAVGEIGYLFKECGTFLKASLAFLRTDRSVFLKELATRQKEYKMHCDKCATTHEKRLTEGTCVPTVSAIYLDIIHGFNGTYTQIGNIIRLVAGLPGPGHSFAAGSFPGIKAGFRSWTDL